MDCFNPRLDRLWRQQAYRQPHPNGSFEYLEHLLQHERGVKRDSESATSGDATTSSATRATALPRFAQGPEDSEQLRERDRGCLIEGGSATILVTVLVLAEDRVESGEDVGTYTHVCVCVQRGDGLMVREGAKRKYKGRRRHRDVET